MLFILKAVLCAFGFKVGKIYANMIFKKITKINMDIKSAEFEAYFESVEKLQKKFHEEIFISMNVCTQYILKDYKR